MSTAADDFIYTPTDFLGWALKSGWQPATLPIGVVYTFQATITRAIAGDDRFVDNPDLIVSNARMFMTADGGAPVLIGCLNPGAASMVTQLEHLRLLTEGHPLAAIVVGTAGAIAGRHSIGDTVIVSSALRTDGISDAYLPPADTVDADDGLVAELATRFEGASTACTWTVKVPYRSTRSDLEAARSANAEVVEMEAASLFAAGQALGIPTAAAVIISDVHRVDEPASVEWSDTLQPSLIALDAAIAALRAVSAL